MNVRVDGRKNSELRPINVVLDFIKYPEGSCLIEWGDTKVICCASIEEKVPPFLQGTGNGWITAEYSMLPRATAVRNVREAAKGKLTGRTQEIQRLIGRSLRAVIDLEALNEKTVRIDCDVIQADGGTRTASITGAFVAMFSALKKANMIYTVKNFVAAVSVGVVNGDVLLDLNYKEDSMATVDMNIVMDDKENFVEIQGTGEERSFTKDELSLMLSLAEKGAKEIISIQKTVLGV